MSIADESFPDIEIQGDLENSIVGTNQFEALNRLPHQNGDQKRLSMNAVIASVSSNSTSNNELAHSVAGDHLRKKTTLSDPTGLAKNEPDDQHFKIDPQNKSTFSSYQSVHSEYTKRRYKHVESKVGQYIANMKAENEKRRNVNSSKFQRHHSMPESTCVTAGSGMLQTRNLGFSHEELFRLEELTSDGEPDIPTTSNSASVSGSASASGSGPASTLSSRDEPSGSIDYDLLIAKLAQVQNENERVQSYSEYLQSKLDEKTGDVIRLKRNLDALRIELSNCKDKLKNLGASTALGLRHYSLQSLVNFPVKSSVGTQTENLSPMLQTPAPSLRIFVTPDTPTQKRNCRRTNNVPQVTLMQPIALNFSNLLDQDSSDGSSLEGAGVLRQRNNSSSTRQSNQLGVNTSKQSHSTSGDSAIDVKVSAVHTRADHEEFNYYNKNSGRFTTIPTLNASNEDGNISPSNEATISSSGRRGNRRGEGGATLRKRSSMRRTWLRIFSACTRCKDEPNQTVNSPNGQEFETQMPLLDASPNVSLSPRQ